MNIVAMFHWDCGSHGEVAGVFVCDRDVLESSYGRFLNFGNVLGTGADISGVLEEEDITVISDDARTVSRVQEVYGETIEGLNPLLFLQEAESCFSEAY